MITKESLFDRVISYAIQEEWLIVSTKTGKVEDMTDYELCTPESYIKHKDSMWIRLKKNGEAIQLRTK